eukprot:comp21045_c0_seq1/m.28293 comp21045_c0_seq1/g.28293  ORF comp21045_c0_seq1/g.28293 comp21045_c0_seq1/m.28293 type:complete len:170 (-) comp21045_c0_seq1:646-1155(-)
MGWWRGLAGLGEGLRQGGLVLQVCACFTVLQDYVLAVSMCQGPSMQPTFNEAGDIVAVEHVSRLTGRLQRGDVVIIRSPQDPATTVCKRIVALEKDFVRLDPTCTLYEDEEYLKVPKGHVWVEGDNRANSTDSRNYGPVPMALICGRAFVKVWPPSSAGWIRRELRNSR